MSDGTDTPLSDSDKSRQWGKAALISLIIVAIIVATGLTPALGSLTGSTPASAANPGAAPPLQSNSTTGSSTSEVVPNGTGGNGTGSESQLGALSPGTQTSVGGNLSTGNRSTFQSLDDEVHFVVTAARPAYWRTNAYGRYTGSGWQQVSTATPYDAPVDVARTDRRVSYHVQLKQAATALPTVWMPRRVETESNMQLNVTPTQAIHGRDIIPAGRTYTGVSYRPPRNPRILRAASGDDPVALHAKYTQLPDSEQATLAPVAANITADAESRYAAAKQTEAWLEANKNYSLSVSVPPTDGVAGQFVTEMDAGYCEYFATSMAALLRAQDIPARYVVGYSPGERTGANEYTVRAKHAHAWVEVYFEDVGWVRFDPTPASDRLDQQSQGIGTGNGAGTSGGSTAATIPGSPGESPPSTDGNHSSLPGESDSGQGQSGGVPTPTSSAGQGQSGTTPGSNNGPTTSGDPSDTASDGTAGPSTTTDRPTTSDSDAGTTEPESTTTTPGTPSTTDNAPTPLNVSLSREPVPGVNLTVTVTRNGTAVEGAPVAFNGDHVGTTNTTGAVTASVPYTGELQITVTPPAEADATPANWRAEPPQPAPNYRPVNLTQSASSTITNATNDTMRETEPATVTPSRAGTTPAGSSHSQRQSAPENNTTVQYSLTTTATITVHGRPVTGNDVRVVTTVDDIPLRNATLSINGTRVGTTNAAGATTLTLPTEPGNATISVERGDVTGNTSLVLPELTATTTPTAPLALPFTDVTVTVSLNDSGVAAAPVTLNGEHVGTTGPNGTMTAQLPMAATATLQVRQYEQTTTSTVDSLYRNTAITAGALAVLVGATAFGKRRAGVSIRGALVRLRTILLGVTRSSITLIVYLAVGAATGLARTARKLWAAVASTVAMLRGRLSPQSLAASVIAWLRGIRQRATDKSAAVSDSLTDVATTIQNANSDTEHASDYRTFRDAWDTFLSQVSVRRPHRYTPEELATHAVTRDDLPADAVQTLRDEFRAVEYGRRDPAVRLERVETATQAIEAAATDEEHGDDESPPSNGGES